MNTKRIPNKLAEDMAGRSICRVKVGAVIVDRKGIVFSWGWNHVNDGYGLHAECHAISRSNRKRLEGSVIYVAGFRARNGLAVPAKPCEDCQRVIEWSGIVGVKYLTVTGWKGYSV